jgi:tetratricopeptide (TPR) repeat protein
LSEGVNVTSQTPEPTVERRLQVQLESFAVDPSDTPAFKTLEEELFLTGAWSQLAGVYECRLSVLEEDTAERSELLLRLGDLLRDRLDAPATARQRYEELLRSDPQHAGALRSLRHLLTGAGELAAALQIADLEEALTLSPAERALVLAETGELWRRLGDGLEARTRFDEALRLDPGSDLALAGLARLAEAAGDVAEAARLHELRLEGLRGAARVEAMEHLANLLPAGEHARLRTLLREIVREEPERRSALERLADLERAAGAWQRVDELCVVLWRIVTDPAERAHLALRAATDQLEEAGDLDAALRWADAAAGCVPDDPRVHELRVRIHRRAGRISGLIDALERLSSLEGHSPMRSLEIAVLHEREGHPEQAIDTLHALIESEPADGEILEVLDRCLARSERHAERLEVLPRRIELAETAHQVAELATALGDLQLQEGEALEDAEAAYRQALSSVPDHAAATERLKQLLRDAERFDELAEFLTGAAERVAAGPPRARLYCELAELESRADPEAARRTYVKALEADPGCRPALLGLRSIAASSGDVSALLEACERELAQRPDTQRRCELLWDIVNASHQVRDLPRARAAAEQWAQLDPTPPAYQALADIGRDIGDIACEQAALENLETVLRDDPERRASCLERLGDLALSQADPRALENAAHWYREALEIIPTSPTRRKLIDLYRRSGQLVELAVQQRVELEALEGEEQRPLRIELARTLAEMGDFRGATSVLFPAFDTDPGEPEVADLIESLLAEQNRIEDLTDVLGRRLARDRDPARRREIALRQGNLLLDELGRAEDAVAVLREPADPSRHAKLEQMFERALEAAGGATVREHETWLTMRESHVDGSERLDLLLRLAALQRERGRVEDSIASLRRAERLVPPEQLDTVRRPLLSLLHEQGNPEAQLSLLERLLEDDDPTSQAAFRIERARILIDDLDRVADGLQELASLEGVPLQVGELRLLAALQGRARAAAGQVRTLQALADATPDDDERTRVLFELANLLANGEDGVRDEDRAESVLQELLGSETGGSQAFEQLTTLLERRDKSEELARILRERLALPDVPDSARTALAHRLARLLAELGKIDEAVLVLRDARVRGAPDSASDELLHHMLELGDQLAECAALCEEKARSESGPERARWLRRWLDAIEKIGGSPERMLQVVDQLLDQEPGNTELVSLRIPLLRSLGPVEALAEALEQLLTKAAGLAGGGRRILVRELLRLYQGVIPDPERALSLIERELANDETLRAQGARLAASIGDAEREAALLAPRVLGPEAEASASPAEIRRLGLAYATLEREADAEPLLWRALENYPRDREVLAALAELLRRRDDPEVVLRLLETQFHFEISEGRTLIAREAAELGRRLADSEGELRWLRRWQALEELPIESGRRWLELERESGQRRGILQALQALREATEQPQSRAELLAEEASLHASAGQLELARAEYEEALETASEAPVDWLVALDQILEVQGKVPERSAVLRDLARHPQLSPEERARIQEARVRLLAGHPEMREEAARELRLLIVGDTAADRELRTGRMRELLQLYEDLEKQLDWCELAERLLLQLEASERLELHRELGRRLAGKLLAPERAVEHWQAVLLEVPGDLEALAALGELLRSPGAESRRAEILERYAEAGALQPAETWLEAAELRWSMLRDAQAALSDVDQALEHRPDWAAAHAIRCQVCARLDHDEEELESLQILLDRSPSGEAAAARWLRLAQLMSRREDGAVEADEAAVRALEAEPEDADLRTAARLVFEQTTSWEKAAELLRQEIEAAEPPLRPRLLRRLTQIEWDELQQPEAADASFEALDSAEALEPEDCERWAEVLESRGRWPEAITRRREALEGRGDLTTALEWLELARLSVEHTGEIEAARQACDQALLRDPKYVEALELRADLHGHLGDHARELDDLVRLADQSSDRAAGALLLSRAATIARERLGDTTRAWALFRSALKKDATHVDALLGVGEIARERTEWPEAERMFGMACSLLADSEESARIASAARSAAEAALRQNRNAEAFAYLEASLEHEPKNAEALEAMAELSLRLGAYPQAREWIEARLELGELEPEARADCLGRLAQACEGSGDLAAAATHLEEVVSLRPSDEVVRARLVDLLEELGDAGRAIDQLDSWAELAAREYGPGLALRAARLEAGSGRRAQARARLEALLEDGPGPGDAWIELAELALEDEGSTGALGVAQRGLDRLAEGENGASLYWIQARALYELGRVEEAAQRASDTLKANPTNVDAAQMLAEHLGQSGDFRDSVTQLERSLDVASPSKPVEAELWEAIGRAYAGPLEDIERAQRAYRRALEANPLRASAREALADITAFDPGSHGESVELHRDLLEAFPSRRGSWHALKRMADHWARERASMTCARVLSALGEAQTVPAEGPALLIRSEDAPNSAVAAATELMLALEEAGALPARGSTAGFPELPAVIGRHLERLAGSSWELHDDQLAVLWREPLDDVALLGEKIPRRARRRMKKALQRIEEAEGRSLDPVIWREELLAQSMAMALTDGQVSLDEALRTLLTLWRTTSHLDLDGGGDLGAALQLCPPARALLLRIADATLAALGV